MFRYEANKDYGNGLIAPLNIETDEYAKHLLLSLCETIDEFQYFNKQLQLLTPTDVTEEIYVAACRVFDKLWDKWTLIRQIGVGTSKVQEDVGRSIIYLICKSMTG